MAENTFRVVSSTLVKTIHVELPDKGVHFAVPEVFGQTICWNLLISLMMNSVPDGAQYNILENS